MAGRTRRNKRRRGGAPRRQPAHGRTAQFAPAAERTADEADSRPYGLPPPSNRPVRPHQLPPPPTPRGRRGVVVSSPELESGAFLSPEQRRLLATQRDARRRGVRRRGGLIAAALLAVPALAAGAAWLAGWL